MARSEEKKKRELGKQYAGLADDELARLAGEAASLTDAAREALRGELTRRRLDIQLTETAEPKISANDDFVVIRKFRDLPEALIAKDVLTSASIKCYLADAATVRMDWFLSNALGGIKLCVPRNDAETALSLLDDDQTAISGDAGSIEFVETRCPQCQSTDVSMRELEKSESQDSSFLDGPTPIEHPGWKCNSCGHTWDEPMDGTE